MLTPQQPRRPSEHREIDQQHRIAVLHFRRGSTPETRRAWAAGLDHDRYSLTTVVDTEHGHLWQTNKHLAHARSIRFEQGHLDLAGLENRPTRSAPVPRPGYPYPATPRSFPKSPFPLTIVEALLASTPVIATNVGSVSEAVIDGETGLLIPPGDVAALVAAIRTLLRDRILAARLGERGRSEAQNRFTSAKMAEGYSTIWSEVDARRRTARLTRLTRLAQSGRLRWGKRAR